jgi:hypothetical protein
MHTCRNNKYRYIKHISRLICQSLYSSQVKKAELLEHEKLEGNSADEGVLRTKDHHPLSGNVVRKFVL